MQASREFLGGPKNQRVLGALGEGVTIIPHSATAIIRPATHSIILAKCGLHWPCDGSNPQTLADEIWILAAAQRSKHQAERIRATHSTLGAMPGCQLFSKHWTWRLGAGFRAQACLFNGGHRLAAYFGRNTNLPSCHLGRCAKTATASLGCRWALGAAFGQMKAHSKGTLRAKFEP